MTCVMGIVNVTPDSFAELEPLVHDGLVNTDAALARAHCLLSDGATIIDVGGESTRPGAGRVAEDTELARTIPVVQALAADGVTVSIDTTRARVAEAAIRAGASIVNDVSGGLADPLMPSIVAGSGAQMVVMHRRGESADMYAHADYSDVVADVSKELTMRVDALTHAGVGANQIILDPGLGFAKLPLHNWQLLANLNSLTKLGLPVLVGASRKRFLGELLANETGQERSVAERDEATAAVSFHAAMSGAWGVRVHQARGSADAIKVATQLTAQRHLEDSSGTAARDSFTGLDTMTLTGISARGHHGVFAFERERGQEFSIDCVIASSNEWSHSDNLADAVNYAEIADRIVEHISGTPVDLIETLADQIARDLLQRYDLRGASVTVHKPQAPIAVPFDDVAVRVIRWSQ